jgi:hypothetical protein
VVPNETAEDFLKLMNHQNKKNKVVDNQYLKRMPLAAIKG